VAITGPIVGAESLRRFTSGDGADGVSEFQAQEYKYV